MRILRLHLAAYGPFTDRVLELGSGDDHAPGLHLVVGANEAGKSSCLRGLTALFFGFPHRCTDDFVHPYDRLLVGGLFALENGARQEIYRRKRRTADLVDGAGEPLDPALATPFLRHLDQDLFHTLYGLDHERLVQGGRDILEQQGETGQVLFAAATGIRSLHRLLASLEEERQAVYKPRASKPPLNQALARHKALTREIRELQLPAGKYLELLQQHKDCQRRCRELRRRRQELNNRLQRLSRLVQAVPEAAALARIEEELAGLGAVPALTPEMIEQFKAVEGERNALAAGLESGRQRLARLRDEVAGLRRTADASLLERGPVIEALNQQLGADRKAAKDRQRLEGGRQTLRREAARLLARLRPDLDLEQLHTLAPLYHNRERLRRLAAEGATLAERCQRTAATCRTVNQRLESCRDKLEKLGAVPEITGLAAAVTAARRTGDLDQRITAGRAKTDRLAAEVQRLLTEAGLWSGTAGELADAALPLPETVARHQRQAATLRDQRLRLEEDHQRLAREIRDLEEDLAQLTGGEPVPDDDLLARCRRQRDQHWQAIRAWYIDGKTDAATAPPDPAALEDAVREADAVADRLRLEAGRLERARQLADLLARRQAEAEERQQAAEQWATAAAAHESEWQEEWAATGVSRVLSPEEMGGWLGRVAELRRRLAELAEHRRELAALEDERGRLRHRLGQALAAVTGERPEGTEPLAPLLALAETVLAGAEGKNTRRDTLAEQLAQLEEERQEADHALQAATAAHEAWRQRWRAATAALFPPGDHPDPPPDEVLDRLALLEEVFAKSQTAGEHQARIRGIDLDHRRFQEAVAVLAQELGETCAPHQTETFLARLQARLTTARQEQALLTAKSEELAALGEELAGKEKELAGLTERRAALLHGAAADDEAGFWRAVDRWQHHRHLSERREAARETLSRLAGNDPLDVFLDEVRHTDPDALTAERERLATELDDEVEPDLQDETERLGRQSEQLAAMDGSSTAADRLQEAAAVAAAMGRLFHRHLCLEAAATVLRRAMDRFRDEHQGPILAAAGDIFQRLTLGSFAGLRQDLDDDGRPVLVGLRPDNRRLGVAAMSDGSRDQLYLALRLAVIRDRLRQGLEPMPLVLDDILVNFDDARSRATLEVLAELGEENQVLLFTHHQNLAELATAVAGPVNVHRLDAPAAG